MRARPHNLLISLARSEELHRVRCFESRRRRSRAAAPGNHPIQRDAFANEICSRRDWENRTANRYYVAERSYHDKSYEETRKTDHFDCRARWTVLELTAPPPVSQNTPRRRSIWLNLDHLWRSNILKFLKMALMHYICITIAYVIVLRMNHVNHITPL